MIDDNFLLYLKALGFTPDLTRNEKGIDVVLSLDLNIASDKRTVEKNNNVSNSTGNLFEQIGEFIPRNKTPGSANAGRKQEEEQGRLWTSIKTDPKAKEKLRTTMTIKKKKQSFLPDTTITTSNGALNKKFNIESHGIHALTSSSTPHRNKIYKVLVVCSSKKGTDYEASRDFIYNFYPKNSVEYTFVDGGTNDTYFPDDVEDEKYNNYFDMIWFAGCNFLKWIFGISFKKLFTTQQARIKRAYDTLKENGIVIFTELPLFKSKRTGKLESSFGHDLSMTIDNMISTPTDSETTRIFKKYFTEQQKGTIRFYVKKKSIVNAERNTMNLQKRNKLGTLSKTNTNNSSSSSKRTTGGLWTRFGRSSPHSFNRNVLSFPTTTSSSSHTSSANSSYFPSLSRTPLRRPINISNKLGISCYMDSVIQCLYWTPGFTRNFLNAEQKGENLLGETFRNIIASYNEGSTNAVEDYTSFLIDLLRGYFFAKTRKSGQQDSQEFLTDLLSILTNMYYTDEYVSKSVVEEDPLPETVQEAIKGNESTETHSFIQDLFQSTVIKTSTCVYCNKESFKAEYQEIFTLEFGLNPPETVFFEDLFNHFCNVDVGKDCFNTTECRKKSNTLRDFYYGRGTDRPDILHNDGYLLHRQQMTILKPAKNLIISFKRFETFADGRMSRKIKTTVANIPVRMNLKNYMYDNNKKKNIIYDLYAFIYHRGVLDGGHYINYVKIKDQWWFVDDTQEALHVITDTDFDSLRKYLAKSYILFYTKIE